MSTTQFKGKTALVTGGAMGIGAACARALANNGAEVVITDLAELEGEATTQQIIDAGGSATFYKQDVTSEQGWVELIKKIQQAHGKLNFLINNAGIAIAASITEMSLEDFHKQNAVNLDGVFLGMKHSIPLIAVSGGGSIVNVSSVAGLKAAPGLSAYAMTKGGVRLLSKSVAKECAMANTNIRVNSVHPGIIETAIWDKMGLQGADGENRTETQTIAETAVPGGVLGKPEDIANGVVYLCSNESRYVNGSELVIDHAYSA